MPDSYKTRKILSALESLGFKKIRQKGSHLFLEHPDGRTTLVPLHDEIRSKLLTKIIKKDIQISKSDFLSLLK